MGCVGPQEGIIILAVVVLILGAGRIPQLGAAIGRSLLNFRRAIGGTDEIDVTPKVDGPKDEEEDPPA